MVAGHCEPPPLAALWLWEQAMGDSAWVKSRVKWNETERSETMGGWIVKLQAKCKLEDGEKNEGG